MLYKRKDSKHWQTQVRVKGKLVRQSTGTEDRKFAKAFEAKLRADLWSAKQLKIVKKSLSECIERYTAQNQHAKRDAAILRKMPLQSRIISEIAESDIHEYLDSVAVRASNSTALRERNSIRALFRAAKKWGWLVNVPEFPSYKPEKFEPKWLTQDQFNKLLAELPPHAAAMAMFAACTGLRYSNVARLKWAHVELGFVPGGETKAGNPIPLVLNDDAQAVLNAHKGKHPVYVFTDDEGHAPCKSIKTCWYKAVKRAGLVGTRFHDLRHSWASWHLKSGTPLHIVQELGGWSSYAMLLQRYRHFATGELKEHANKLKLEDK